MNSETTALIERPYQEIVDDILTAIVGGVVNEPIIFDVNSTVYPLAEPAQGVRGITGTVAQERHTFQTEIDFVFSADNAAVVWQEGGARPDDETTFFVDYFRQDSRSPLTDINVGSVTRTLSEAIGREIATVYQQINRAYFSAFIDTAEGKSLDLVVAILGITRKTADFAVGLVTFFRDPAVEGNITIPPGTLLSTAKGDATFVTSQVRTLQRGQVRIDVPVRASGDSRGEAGQVDAGTINTLAQPMAGIHRVTNFEPTVLGAEDETDEELRARAKAAVRALGKGTLAALARVIAEERAKLVEVWDPNSPPAKRANPGTVTLLIESEPERFPSLQAAVEQTRAAGVQATLVARYVFFKPRIVAQIMPGLTAAGQKKIVDEIITALRNYVDGLSSGDSVKGEALLDAITGVQGVKKQNTKMVDVIAWRADVGEPGKQSLIEAVLQALEGVPLDDRDARRKAVEGAITSEAPSLVPAVRRIPDRSLVQTPDGDRATDEDIEAGNFNVVTPTASPDEKWWVMLDIQPADIVLQES